MTPLIAQFKSSCHVAGDKFKCSPARFGLNDFLENGISDSADREAIVIKALRFFCGEASPNEIVFQFGVVATCEFLHRLAGYKGSISTQSAKDLIALLSSKPSDESIRGWIASHYS